MSDFTSAYGSRPMAVLRIFGFFALIAALVPVQLAHNFTKPEDPFRIVLLFHRLLLRLLGLRVRVHGTMATTSPVLFVANHTSYLDIPVLSALIPAAFVAKAEVARWPLIGFLAKMQNTVFVERRSSQVNLHRGSLRARMAKGQSLIVFPEGTSTDGLKVLPFKSSLFSLFEESPTDTALALQAVSIACTGLDGLPMTRALRPFYAWYGDMTLVRHLWDVFKLGHFMVDVIFHPPIDPESFGNRKILALACHEQVARGIEQCLKGRGFASERELVKLPATA